MISPREPKPPPLSGALPDFLILGAMKAGTTSLFRYLLLHPAVAPPAKKEVRFFSQYYRHGVDWYRTHFQGVELGKITGEATPAYLFHEKAPQRAFDVVPHAKLIALLRDPVDRAYSQYHHMQRKEASERSLLLKTFEEEAAALARPDVSRRELPSTLLSRGLYATQLRRWEATYSARQLLVMQSEAMFADPLQALADVARFLEIDPAGWDSKHDQIVPHNQHPYDPSEEAERDWLRAFFAPHNEELYRHLGRDFGWSRP